MGWWGRHLLLDPYLSDSLTKKYANTDKPHVRMTARVIDPARLDFIDVVTSSHNHTDHLDDQTLVPLLHANPRLIVVVPAANIGFAAARLGLTPGEEAPPAPNNGGARGESGAASISGPLIIGGGGGQDGCLRNLLGVDDGLTVEAAGFAITGVPAAHEEIERDEEGRHKFLGCVVRCGPWTLYHSGDTVRYAGMAERLRPFGVDVALLPINGRAPERRVAGNLDGPEAARLAHDIGAGLVIPCHYEMFAFNTAAPDAFVAEAERLGQPHRVLRGGERWSSEK